MNGCQMPIEVFYFRAHVNRPEPISVRGTTKETSHISIPSAGIMNTMLLGYAPLPEYLTEFSTNKTIMTNANYSRIEFLGNNILDPDLVHLSDRNR